MDLVDGNACAGPETLERAVREARQSFYVKALGLKQLASFRS
jgi:hypothetical protein